MKPYFMLLLLLTSPLAHAKEIFFSCLASDFIYPDEPLTCKYQLPHDVSRTASLLDIYRAGYTLYFAHPNGYQHFALNFNNIEQAKKKRTFNELIICFGPNTKQYPPDLKLKCLRSRLAQSDSDIFQKTVSTLKDEHYFLIHRISSNNDIKFGEKSYSIYALYRTK